MSVSELEVLRLTTHSSILYGLFMSEAVLLVQS